MKAKQKAKIKRSKLEHSLKLYVTCEIDREFEAKNIWSVQEVIDVTQICESFTNAELVNSDYSLADAVKRCGSEFDSETEYVEIFEVVITRKKVLKKVNECVDISNTFGIDQK